MAFGEVFICIGAQSNLIEHPQAVILTCCHGCQWTIKFVVQVGRPVEL